MRTLRIVGALAAPFVVAVTLWGQSLEAQLQRAVQREEATGDRKAAAAEYKRIADSAGKNGALAAQALLHLAESYRHLGDAEAQRVYQRITQEYGDQPAAAIARVRLEAKTAPGVVDRVIWTVPSGGRFELSRVSPDGRRLAFSTEHDLMLRDLTTGRERSVAHFASGQPGPTIAWSPDSRRLVFEVEGGGTDIMVVNADGSGLRTVMTKHPSWARVLDFSPDGTRVLCSRGEGEGLGDTFVFWLTIADGTRTHVVMKKGPGGSGWPRLSPDGKYIAIRNTPGLSLLSADGKSEIPISRNGGDLNPMGWSPDGKGLSRN